MYFASVRGKLLCVPGDCGPMGSVPWASRLAPLISTGKMIVVRSNTFQN